jgi:hypothetical protein
MDDAQSKWVCRALVQLDSILCKLELLHKIMKSLLLYVKNHGIHKISDAIHMRTCTSVCVRACVCVGGGACTFITGCSFSHLPENATVMGWPGKQRLSISQSCSAHRSKKRNTLYFVFHYYTHVYDILIWVYSIMCKNVQYLIKLYKIMCLHL